MSASSHLLYSNYVEKTFVEDCASAFEKFEDKLRVVQHHSHDSYTITVLADLYGLLKAMESLENAWIRDIVDADSYQRMCQRLISQKRELYDGEFKSKVHTVTHSVNIALPVFLVSQSLAWPYVSEIQKTWVHINAMQVGPLQKFAEEYNIHVRRAIRRYEKGVPATVEMPDRDNTGAGVIIQVTQDILEFKDMLYLKMTDIDQVRQTSAKGLLARFGS